MRSIRCRSVLPFAACVAVLGLALAAQTSSVDIGVRATSTMTNAVAGGVGYVGSDRVVILVEVNEPALDARLVDSPAVNANVIAVLRAASPGSRRRFGTVADVAGIRQLVTQGNVWLRVATQGLDALVGQVQLDTPEDAFVTLDDGFGKVFLEFEIHPVSGVVSSFKLEELPIAANGLTAVEIVAGTPQSPGAVLATIGVPSQESRSILVAPGVIQAIRSGAVFCRAVGDPGLFGELELGSPTQHALIDSGVDGPTNNAVAFLRRQPGPFVAALVRTQSFPFNVTAVNIFENGTNASYGPTFPVGGGDFLMPPAQSLTPSQLASLKTENVTIELVTASGNFSAGIVDEDPPFVLLVGSPGLNGNVPQGEFSAEALVGFGYEVAVSGADPNAAAIPLLGFELHAPAVSLAAFGLDDEVWVKVVTPLPLGVLDSTGTALWPQSLPNDTSFAGLPLVTQIAVLSGLDGLSMSSVARTTVAPN
ncbi:MAG: hypothetical protein NXI31_02060 [bacterium]|nr:hypothetical protein [bacterium]